MGTIWEMEEQQVPVEDGTRYAREPREQMDKLFRAMEKLGASDLHLQAGMPPMMRVKGALRPTSYPVLSDEDAKALVYSLLTAKEQARFEDMGDLDKAVEVPGAGRFRLNVLRQRGKVGLVARKVNTFIPPIEQLHLPPILRQVASYHQGMVIIAGPTGSGKSTTLASILDHVNETRRCHILTIEDPIEYLHTNKKAYINQREIGSDTANFKDALRYAMRQDPDVILVGEMRDEETMQFGLRAAETGHLVLTTLHASTAPQTLQRILDLFPPEKHFQIRRSLAFNLKAVICQRLLPSCKEGVGRVPAVEIMIVNAVVRKMIQEGQDTQLPRTIRLSFKEGMQDFNVSLYRLVKEGYVAAEEAFKESPNPEQLRMNLQGIFLDEDRAIATTS